MNALREQPMAYCEGDCGTLVRAENRVCMRCAEKIRSACVADAQHATALRLAAKQGTHDWGAQPRVMVDECECGETGTWEALGIAGLMILLLVCSLTGALVLGSALRGTLAHGFSATEFGHQMASRLRP